MEGLHGPAVREALGVPPRFDVAMVIATGYPLKEDQNGSSTAGRESNDEPTARYALEEVVSWDSFSFDDVERHRSNCSRSKK